jgi:hypothetical protein
MMTREQALNALTDYRIMALRRDHLIRAAAAAGVPETQIAAAAGVARDTVRKALGKCSPMRSTSRSSSTG